MNNYIEGIKIINKRDNITLHIHAIGRLGLKEDMPEVHSFLSNFTLEDEQLASLMSAIVEADDDMEATKKWLKENEELVD